MKKRPKGYVGTGHETIGSDILAVHRALTFPLGVLGPEHVARLEQVDPAGWYPIGWLLELMERLDQRLGAIGLVKMGRTLFKLSHEQRVLEVASSARDIVYGIDAMYHHANRGTGIGGWKVLSFEPGRAVLEKTTPHHCAVEEGILAAALDAVKAPGRVNQLACMRQGADSCMFQISSEIRGDLWSGDDAESSRRKISAPPNTKR